MAKKTIASNQNEGSNFHENFKFGKKFVGCDSRKKCILMTHRVLDDGGTTVDQFLSTSINIIYP